MGETLSQGFADAQYAVAKLYGHALGVPLNFAEQAAWINKLRTRDIRVPRPSWLSALSQQFDFASKLTGFASLQTSVAPVLGVGCSAFTAVGYLATI